MSNPVESTDDTHAISGDASPACEPKAGARGQQDEHDASQPQPQQPSHAQPRSLASDDSGAMEVPGGLEMSTLSEELRELLQKADGKPMTLGQILDQLEDRGHTMFIIVIIGPFLFLPTTFGLSAPIGFAIAIIGLCMLIHVKPWLPGFILRKTFPYEGLAKVVNRAAGMADRVQKVARPRLGVMFWPGLINITGVELTIWALLMALPGPNFVFAFMITLIAFGLLMRDGIFLIAAHVLTFITPVVVWYYWTPIWDFVQTYAAKLAQYWDRFTALIAMVG